MVTHAAVPVSRLLIYFLLYCIQIIKEMPAALIAAQKAFLLLFPHFSCHSDNRFFTAVVRKLVDSHQRNRFFTPCHCSVSHLSHKAFLPPFRMTADGKAS